jgi:hypothetical protein
VKMVICPICGKEEELWYILEYGGGGEGFA